MKKTMKAAKGMMGAGIGLGVGSEVLGDIGGASAGHAQAGLSKISGAMPTMGKMVGAGMVMGGIRGLQDATEPMNKKKKRY